MRQYILFLWGITLSTYGTCQSIPVEIIVPNLLSNGLNDFSLVDPSYINEHTRISLNTTYEQYTKTSNDIRNFHTNFNYSIKEKNKIQNFRLQFSNSNDGPFISSPSAYFNYSLALQINKKIRLQSGISLGMFSRFYSAPSSTGAGNAIVPDGNFAFALKSKNARLSIILNQIFNTIGDPQLSGFQLKRFLSASYYKKIELAPLWNIYGYTYLRQLPAIGTQAIILSQIEYNKNVGLTIGYKSTKQAFVTGRITSERFNGKTNLSFTYNTPFASSKIYINNSVEIAIGFLFD